MLEAIFWIAEEVVAAGSRCQQGIRRLVKTPENIGKMLTIDVETGKYKIGINSSKGEIGLKQSRPMARLFTVRIGYDVGVSFDGSSERIVK